SGPGHTNISIISLTTLFRSLRSTNQSYDRYVTRHPEQEVTAEVVSLNGPRPAGPIPTLEVPGARRGLAAASPLRAPGTSSVGIGPAGRGPFSETTSAVTSCSGWRVTYRSYD